MSSTPLTRCAWVNSANPLYVAYHDEEWGVPCHDEVRLFEMLNLEGAQAGLSWELILRKREQYRAAFDDWDADKIATYDEDRQRLLLQNPGIIRNRLKLRAIVANAQAYLRLRQQRGGLAPYLWSCVDGAPVCNHPETPSAVPASSPLSLRISQDLKQLGFKFVGPTIVYSYLQAVGVVNDHCTDCFRYFQLLQK